MKHVFQISALLLGSLLMGCSEDTQPDDSRYEWNLPIGVPLPQVPDDNPMNDAKVELGRHLFYDPNLSGNKTQSCASCHLQEHGFADPNTNAVGSTGIIHPKNSMGLTNIAYASSLTWANPLVPNLEEQMLTPMFGEEPVELGLPSTEVLLERIASEPKYGDMFEAAFPEIQGEISLDTITKAIASFERSLLSFNSPYDQYIYNDKRDALSAEAKKGMQLFFSERFECFHCHGGFNFSDSVKHDGTVFDEVAFHNNGLYNIQGSGAYPDGNQGVFDITGLIEDTGAFKAPTLRNIAKTAPYMHDGSIATLEDVLEHYARGGRKIESGSLAGDGKLNPFKSEFVNGFTMTDEEKQALIAFLNALTDESFLTNPNLSNPWPQTQGD